MSATSLFWGLSSRWDLDLESSILVSLGLQGYIVEEIMSCSCGRLRLGYKLYLDTWLRLVTARWSPRRLPSNGGVP